jgi:hypothetical protein
MIQNFHWSLPVLTKSSFSIAIHEGSALEHHSGIKFGDAPMNTMLLLMVLFCVTGAALAALGIAREIKKPRTNFDDERADNA